MAERAVRYSDAANRLFREVKEKGRPHVLVQAVLAAIFLWQCGLLWEERGERSMQMTRTEPSLWSMMPPGLTGHLEGYDFAT